MVRFYWQEELSSIVPVFFEIIEEELEEVREFFGREVQDIIFILFLDRDSVEFDVFFHPPVVLMNFGGLRVERMFHHIRTYREMVRGALGCAALRGIPRTFEIIPPNYFIPSHYMKAFCDYMSMREDFFSFPFYGSRHAGTIKFIERKYGRRKVLELFSDGGIIREDFSMYEREFLVWRRTKFINEEKEKRRHPAFFLKYVHGLHNFRNSIVTFHDGKLVDVTHDMDMTEQNVLVDLDISSDDFGYINGDSRNIVFDVREDGFFKIYVISENLKPRRVELGDNIRGWYPDVISDKLFFVKKGVEYDELCFMWLTEDVPIDCIFVTERHSEIFTPDISPDGTKIAFAIRRSNDFFDIAILDLITGEFTSVTQDSFIDVFPKWFSSEIIVFASDRIGPFNLFQFDLRTREVTRITEHSEGIFFGVPHVHPGKMKAISYEAFSLLPVDLEVRHIEKIVARRESMYARNYESISEVKRAGIIPKNLGILFPYVYGKVPGFLIWRFVLFMTDDLFRSNIYFGLDHRLPFSKVEHDLLRGTPNLGLFTRGLLRFSEPFIFFDFRYEPFGGIFIRTVDGDHVFFPEKSVSFDLFFPYALRKTLIFPGVRFASYELIDVLGTDSFWSMVRREYENFGAGFFVIPRLGLLFRSAKKGFSLRDGFDFFLLSSLNVEDLGFSTDFSLDIFSPEIEFVVFNVGLNGSFATGKAKRFWMVFGSKEVPYYFDPPHDMNPLQRFGLAIPDLYGFGHDVGNVRGLRVRRSDLGLVLNLRLYLNVFRRDFSLPVDLHFVNLVPFISTAAIRDLDEHFDVLYSFGLGVDFEGILLFSLPLTLRFGFAHGEIRELYFSIYITRGALR